MIIKWFSNLSKRKKLTVVFFFYMYMMSFAVVTWLVFFNTGLEIVERTTFEEGKQLFFRNSSNRVIHNITISWVKENGDKTILMEIPKAPQDMREK